MKFIYFFLLATLSIVADMKAQASSFPAEPCELYCTYNFTFQPDSTNVIKRTEIMWLLIGKSASEFQSLGNYLADSLYQIMAATPGGPEKTHFFLDKRMALPKSRFYYKIYKYRTTNTAYIYEKIVDKTYRYTERSYLIWNITTEKKEIAGYACQKAATSFAGRSYVAWFTKEVPVSEGPYKFCGLPGLIIELSDTRQQFQFKLTRLFKVQQAMNIALPKQAVVETNKKAVQSALRDYYINLPNIVPSGTAQNRESLRSDIKSKYNNSLELY